MASDHIPPETGPARLLRVSPSVQPGRLSSMDETELQCMEFYSWEGFCTFFDAWCVKRKTLFFIRNYYPLNKTKWAVENLPWEVVEALKYHSVRLACKNINISSKKLRDYKQRKKPSLLDVDYPKDHQSCSAYISLKISEKKNSLIVTKCKLRHNHALCPIEFDYYYKNGLLLENCCLPIRTTNNISKQFVGAQDIKRVMSYCKTKGHGIMDTLKSLDCLFDKDPDAKVKLVFLQDKAVVKTVFLMTSLMASLCQRFPSVLFFNKVLSFNEDFDLYSFLCADDKLQGRACAYILVRKETTNILRFSSASLVQSVPGLKFKVQCVTVGVDIGEKEVIKEIFPNATVQMLRSQVLQTLNSKAHEMGVKEDEKIWPLLCHIASSKTPEEYNLAVRNMDLFCSSAFMKYFMEEWHTLRDTWVEIWCFRLANLDTTSLVSQHRQKLTAHLCSISTVAECILHLVSLQSLKTENPLNEDEIVSQYKSVCNPEAASMIEEELGFLRDDKYNSKQTPDGYSLNDGVSEFFMDQDLVTCSCTIHVSSLLPCRHLFATRLQNGQELFDLKLLNSKVTLT